MEKAVGQVISFYSFKGGVGRSMALANIAALLCKSGKSVLIVDWDLEAPGLHKFFEQHSPQLKEKIKQKPGILDLISSACTDKKISWRECIIEIRLPGGFLHFISAGRVNSEYGSRLQQLQWQQLYDIYNIGQVFEDMRNEWKQAYNYVMLDSRTGVTDIGDVCTALFPDWLITVFVANEQNIEGTKQIIERARAVHKELPRDRTKLIVIPLLGRDEIYTEYELSTSWRGRIGGELGFTLADWMPKSVEPASYFNKIFIPYYSYWSFGENLPVIQRSSELENPASISAAYGRVASLIESNLDWSVLEHGVSSAEINVLRERASHGEAKEAKFKEFTQKIWKLAVNVMIVVAIVVGGVATVILFSAKFQLAEESGTNADQTAHLNQLEQQKSDLARQIAGLQKQNQDLLDKLAKTNTQLEHQNTTIQQKLDELLQGRSQ